MFPRDWGLPAEESRNSLLRGRVRTEQRHYVSAPLRSAANSLRFGAASICRKFPRPGNRSLDQHRGFEYASHWRKLIGQGATRPPAPPLAVGLFSAQSAAPDPAPIPPLFPSTTASYRPFSRRTRPTTVASRCCEHSSGRPLFAKTVTGDTISAERRGLGNG